MPQAAYEITFYEGLIRKTAAMYGGSIQEDYEDVVAILRIKVWRALQAYDPARSRMPVERFVFSCVKNQVKDLIARRRRHEIYWSDMTAVGEVDEIAVLMVSDEIVYAEVEREIPVIPSTLTAVERDVVCRLYIGDTQRDIAQALGLRRAEMERIVRSIRDKLADWRPTSAQPTAVAA